MSDLAIIVGNSPEAVIATAEARQIQIDPHDIRAFSSLTTTYAPGFAPSGQIEIDQEGFIAIGVML